MRGCTGTARRSTGRARGGAPDYADSDLWPDRIPVLFPVAAKVREIAYKNGRPRRVRNAEAASSNLAPSTTIF
jgi:hypothetical protein